MSTIFHKKNIRNEFYVIAMAFGYKPVKLKCLLDEKGTIKVAGENSNEWMGYPKQYLYEFNKGLFEKLRAAYIKEDKACLYCLWQEANPLLVELKNY